MIAKHVAMKSAQRGDFAGLMKYIADTQAKHERVGNVAVTNCHSDRADSAMVEILNTQARNTRTNADKTYHLIISFAQGEAPAQDVLEAIEVRICAAIGFSQHQRISVVHHDTDSLHIHVAINKIHPQRYTIHEPFNAYHTLGQVCEKLEKEFGLQQVTHTAKKARGENSADDMERQSHVESLLGWIKRECTGSMRNAQTWSAMHAVMRAHGLTLHERANGLVVSAENGITVKASSIAREFSKVSLEKKLGMFEPLGSGASGEAPTKRYNKKPMRSRVNTSELHAKYKDEQQEVYVRRAAAWNSAKAHKDREVEATKRKGRLKRAAIKLLRMPGIERKLLYAATSKTLREEINATNEAYLKERQAIYQSHQRRSWVDWLRDRAKDGDIEALDALRAHQAADGLKGNTVRGTGKKAEPRVDAGPDSVTKKGTRIYHVGDSAIRDDGNKLKVSRGADQAGLEAALRMAIERYGNCITVNGSAAFKESIVKAAVAAQLPVSFDDAMLERRRRQLTQPLKQKEGKHGNDSSNNDDIAGRPAHGSNGSARQSTASRAARATRHATFTTRPGGRHTHGKQPDTGSAGRATPPARAHGVRGLSKLGVVHVSNRSEVLLPGNVPDHMEHQRTKPDHGMRRHLRRSGPLTAVSATGRASTLVKFANLMNGKSKTSSLARKRARRPPRPFATGVTRPETLRGLTIPSGKPNVGKVGSAPPPSSKDRLRPLSNLGDMAIGERAPRNAAASQPSISPQAPVAVAEVPHTFAKHASLLSPAEQAAEKYVIEREQKRCNGFDITKHSRYNFSKEMSAVFAGMRQVDGQQLALLKISEEIFVKPVDESTARRLKRLALGQEIVVKTQGVIRTKGRGR